MKHLRRHSVGMLGFFLLTIASFLIAADTDAATGINDQISFQGKVVNTNGTNVANGNYDFVFQLYTVSSGGTNIWTETWNSGTSQVTVTDGIFQVNLGTYTDLPGSVDFNTDNIYLGINFNADGEMSPRVHFTAAPYAFNAQKVGGLTVTDTTGTLTIPNSETISFGGSFSTTASNDIALTTSGTTTLTLPTTGTLATLSGTEEFTNKAIGSTGLTFSGATTDITTASGESLVIVANGAGVIDLQDATTVDSLTTDTGGISIAAGQSYTGAGAVSLSSAATTALTVDSGTTGTLNFGTGNNAKTISLGTGTAGNTINIATDNTTSDTIAIGSVLDNVAITGDQWSITDAGVLTVASCSGCGGGGGTLDSAYTAGNTIGTDSGSNVIINLADVATPTEVTINNLDASGTNALQIDNSTTLTNGLLIEQSAAGTLTNALQVLATAGTITNGLLIADGAGAVTNGIQLTGTFTTTFLDTPSIDITGTGAITGATGVGTTTVTATSTIDAQGDISDSLGNLTLNDAVDISGALAVSGTSLTATSATTITLGSTGADTIILGNAGADTITIGNAASTGVSIVDNNWSVTTAGVASFITGTVIGSQTFTTNTITDSGALAITSATSNALTLDSGTTGTVNLGTGNNAKTVAIATGTAGNTINIATDNTTSDTINIGSVLDNVAITGDQWSVTNAGVLTVASCSGCGGGGGDLQTTYGADADGSNATISLTAADDGLVFTNPSSGGNNLSAFVLQVSQQHTTDAIAILDLVQSSNAANGVNLTANSIDGETGLAITANGLTAGSGLTVASSSTAFTGSLAGITLSGSDAANTGNVFAVSNTGTANANTSLFVQHNATGTNNLAVRINDVASDSTPFVIDGAGNVGVGTAAPSRVMDIFQAASAPQLRLSKDLTNYSEFTVDSVGDLQLAATGTDIRALSENLWVCDNDACPALTLTGDGNIFIENVLKFGNGVYMKNDSATELGVYDNDDQAMLIFDEL